MRRRRRCQRQRCADRIGDDHGDGGEDQVLTASNTLADADGLGPSATTGSATAPICRRHRLDLHAGRRRRGPQISVVASFTDGRGTVEASPVRRRRRGQRQRCADRIGDDHGDGDGRSGADGVEHPGGCGRARPISYHWQRDGSDVTGATGATYTLGDADVGAQISVVASYTDGQSFAEISTSAATAAVLQVINGSAVDGYIAGALVFLTPMKMASTIPEKSPRRPMLPVTSYWLAAAVPLLSQAVSISRPI